MASMLPPLPRRKGTPSGDSGAGSRGDLGEGAGPRGNPFELPSDEEIFRRIEAERLQRAQARERNLQASVKDKSTFSARMAAIDVSGLDVHDRTTARTALKEISAAAATMPTDHRAGERESMADFIAKKREIFLVQMSLDTKKSEIRKLEERAAQREEALKRSKELLDQHQQKFDDFLAEDRDKVQTAQTKAEIQTKIKLDRLAEIKKLVQQKEALNAELTKYEDQLNECKTYKEFLDNLTPPEFFEEQEQRKRKIVAERMDRWERDCRELDARKAEAHEVLVKAQEAFDNAGTIQEEERAREALAVARKTYEAIRDRPRPPMPPKDLGPDDWQEPMYFKTPGQLLEVFTQLEEQNLFLIQNAQETEEQLEELRLKFKETKERMDAETESLQEQIAALEVGIAAQRERVKALEGKAQISGVAEQGAGSITLDDLHKKVKEVFETCLGEKDGAQDTISMLKAIEVRMERYLSDIAEIPSDVLMEAEKAREKERRQKARERKISEQVEERARKAKASLARALDKPVPKKKDKPVMFRSVLPKKKVSKTHERKQDLEEIALEEFLARDFGV